MSLIMMQDREKSETGVKFISRPLYNHNRLEKKYISMRGTSFLDYFLICPLFSRKKYRIRSYGPCTIIKLRENSPRNPIFSFKMLSPLQNYIPEDKKRFQNNHRPCIIEKSHVPISRNARNRNVNQPGASDRIF